MQRQQMTVLHMFGATYFGFVTTSWNTGTLDTPVQRDIQLNIQVTPHMSTHCADCTLFKYPVLTVIT